MKIAQLTSLRFFAALGVFLTHYNQFYLNSTNPVIMSLRKVFFEGYVWVGFFFILSGFIISYSQDKKNHQDSAGHFLLKRFARVYPVQIFMLVFFLIYFHGTWVADQQKSILYSVFLIQSWIPDTHVFWGYNAVSWSISTEVFFYIAFIPAAKLKTKHLFILFSSLITMLFASHLYNFKSTDDIAWFYYINPASRFVDFAAGMLIYRLFNHIKNNEKIHNLNWTALEFSSIALMLLFMGIAVSTQFTKSFRYDIYYIIPMSLIIFVFAFGKGIVSRSISGRFFVILGEVSFCMYMMHQTIIAIILLKIIPDINSAQTWQYFSAAPALLIVVVIISIFVHFLYEKPMAKFIVTKFAFNRRAAVKN